MNFFSKLSTTARPWLLLALSALAIELCALFFQYVLDLQPCIMCVYQRVAIISIIFAGIIGFVGHAFIFARLIAYALWATGAIWGLLLAIEHVEMQSAAGSLFFSCDLFPNFPTWAPLHDWMPWLFEATGDCGDINWQLLGYSMPQWMIVVYGGFTLAFAVIFLSRLIVAKKP